MTTLTVADAVQALEPFLLDWMETQRFKTRIPGVQVAIRHRGELLLSRAFGVANQATGEKLTTRHGFRIASHSKTFTATAVMQQVERGTLRLDDTLGQWVSELEPTPAGTVTIRDLLSHQAGIARDGRDANFWQLDHRFHDRESLVVELSQDLVLDPQRHFHYSNVAYSALGLVLESVTGRSWHQVMLDLLDELGPVKLGPELGVGPAITMAAGHSQPMSTDGHRCQGEPQVIAPVNTHAEGAATGFWGTAEGTTAWLSAHSFGTDQLLSDTSKRLMQRKESTITEAGLTRWYGLGLVKSMAGEREVVGHSGGFPGHITQTWVDPVENLSVAVLTNRLGSNASEWATMILRMIDLVRDTAALPATSTAGTAQAAGSGDFVGCFQNLWGTSHLVPAGQRVLRLNTEQPDPVTGSQPLEVLDSLTLLSPAKDGYADCGETSVLTRTKSGAISSITTTGVTSWPPASFRRKLPSLLSGERLASA